MARNACCLLPNKICLEPTTRLDSSLSSLCRNETLSINHGSASNLTSPLTQQTFASLLRCCRDSKYLSHGKHIHSIVITCGFDHHTFFQNLLIQMYGSCGALEDASVLLLNMPLRNKFSWTFIIRAYAEQGYANKSLEYFEQMKLEGMSLLSCKFLCISILSVFDCDSRAFNCKILHILLLNSEIQLDHVLGAALVNAYRRCKSPEDAERTFWSSPEKDVFLYNIMIGMHVKNGNRIGALQLSYRMHLEGLMFDNVTLVSTLGACASEETYNEGRQIHASFSGSLVGADACVCNAVLSMYSKAGSLRDARTMFSKMEKRNMISWNAMIAYYVKNKEFKQAILFFEQMQHQKMEPSKITFITVLSACADLDALMDGKVLYAYNLDAGFESDIATGNALITMYGVCASLNDAHKVFNDLPQRDGTSWTSIITAYIINCKCMDACQLFDNMHSDLTLDQATQVSILSVCASKLLSGYKTENIWMDKCFKVCYNKRLDIAQRVFDIMPMHDVMMWSIIIASYAQSGYENVALDLFGQMHHENVIPDKHICASVLSACASLGYLKEGKHLHAWVMCNDGFEVDSTLWNALINLYGKCGSMEDAQVMFDTMPWHDAVTWTAIIEAYAKNAEGETALQFYQQMLLEGIIPDTVTLVGIFTTCSSFPALVQGKQMHACTKESAYENCSLTRNALINMYAKCGSLQAARATFDDIPERDVSLWNVMITGYAQNGQVKEALHLFWQMQEEVVSPDMVTLISVLSACSHGGLSYDALNHFYSMRPNYDVKPVVEHYNGMIDTFGRSGRLDLADELLRTMPCQPNVVSWMTFLGACKYQLDLEQATRAANIILELDPQNLAPYVLLVNIYAACGQAERSSAIMNIKACCLHEFCLGVRWS